MIRLSKAVILKSVTWNGSGLVVAYDRAGAYQLLIECWPTLEPFQVRQIIESDPTKNKTEIFCFNQSTEYTFKILGTWADGSKSVWSNQKTGIAQRRTEIQAGGGSMQAIPDKAKLEGKDEVSLFSQVGLPCLWESIPPIPSSIPYKEPDFLRIHKHLLPHSEVFDLG